MTFEYSKDIIKKHMQEGIFWLALSISLFAIFFFCNFNYGALKGTSTASLKANHIGVLKDYWYAIVGIIIIFLSTPKLKAAINRKITKYEIANSGIYVISTLNNSRAIVRWKDITGLIEDLDKISIVYDTKKLIIYSDLDMFEKFRAFIENNLTKAVRDKLNFKKKKKEKLSKEEEARRAELAKIEKEKEEKKKNTRMLLDQVLEDDSAKPNAIRKTEEERDAELSAVPKKLNQDFKSNKDSSSGDSKGSLINAFLSGANEEETTKVSKSTMVMSKSVFKELTKKALAKRNRENAVSDSELNENTSNVENNDEEQELEPTRPMGGLRSRINKSTLKKDKSSILLSSIASQEEEKSRKEKERVEFSLDRLMEADSEVDKQEQKLEEEKQKEEKQRKSNLLSEFLTTGKLGSDVLKKFGGDKFSSEDKKVDLTKETVIQPVDDISKDFGQFEKEERSRNPITSKSLFGQEEPPQSSFVQEKPVLQGQSLFSQEEPPQPSFVQEESILQEQSLSAQEESLQPSFVQEEPVLQGQPLFGHVEPLQPSFVQEEPVSQGQSLFGQEVPPQPSFAQEEPVSQGQSLFAQEVPPQPSFVQEEPVSQGQSLFGQEVPPQPSFVQEEPVSQEHSLFGQEEPPQPSFVQEEPISKEQSLLGQFDVSKEFGQFERERTRESISSKPLFANEEKVEVFSQDLPAFVQDKKELNQEKLSVNQEESLSKSDILKDFEQEGERKRESLVTQSDATNQQPLLTQLDVSKDFANFAKERSRESVISDKKDNDLYGTSLIEKDKEIPNILAITDEVLTELAIEKGEQQVEQVKENKEEQRVDIRKSVSRRRGRKTKTDIPKKIALNTNVDVLKEVENSSISDKDIKNFKKSSKNKKFEKLTLDVLNSKTKEEIEQEILQKQAEERAKEEARLRAEEEERKKIADEEALKEKQRDLDIGKTIEMSSKKETLKHVDYDNVELNDLIRPTQSGKLPELGKYILPTPSGHLPDLNSLIKPTQSGKLPDLSNIIQPTPSGHLPDLSSLIANLKSKKKSSDTPVEMASEKETKSIEKVDNSDGRYMGEDYVDRKRTVDIPPSIPRDTMEMTSGFANITNVDSTKEGVNEISNSSQLPDLNSLIKPTYSSKLSNLNDLVKTSQPKNQVSEQLPDLNNLIKPSQLRNQVSEQLPNLNDLVKPSQQRNQVSEQVPNLNDLIKPSQSGNLPDLNSLIKPTQSGHLPDLNDLIKPTQSGHLPDLAKYINPTPSGHLPDLNELIQPTQSGHLPDLNSLLNNSKLSNIKKNKTQDNDDSNFGQENVNKPNLMDNVKTLGSNNDDPLRLMNKNSRFKRRFRNSQSQDLPKLEDLLGKNVDRKRESDQGNIDSE